MRRITFRVGVSEVVSSMIILLIVVIVGVMLYLNLYYTATLNQQILSKELIEEEIKAQEHLSLLLVTGSSTSNNITIILASGTNPVNIVSIYVNDTLAISYNPPLTLGSLEVYELTVESPIELTTNSIIRVKVIFKGGTVESWGEVS